MDSGDVDVELLEPFVEELVGLEVSWATLEFKLFTFLLKDNTSANKVISKIMHTTRPKNIILSKVL